MQLIKLSTTTGPPTELGQGESVNGWTSVTWVERYASAGEFKIEAPLSSNLKAFLPIGSFVSHVGTEELMMVENHEIQEPEDEDSTITITGRSFFAFMENRSMGVNATAYAGGAIPKYLLSSAQSAVQIETFINSNVINPYSLLDALAGVDVDNTVSIAYPLTVEQREIKYGNVYERTLELLAIDELGLKCKRPTSTDPLTYYLIYIGQDKTSTVRFNRLQGDLKYLAYLITNKTRKNIAHVIGRWVHVMTDNPLDEGYDRRMIIVDGSDIDQDLDAAPVGGALTAIVNKMKIRGNESLYIQNETSITQADLSDKVQAVYRRDYNLGDLVMVEGNFGTSEVKRVVEFAEIADRNSSSGHPTLKTPGVIL